MDLDYHIWDDLDLNHVTDMTRLSSLRIDGDSSESPLLAGNKLALLGSLPCLHTLDLTFVEDPQLNTAGLQALRKLSLTACDLRVYDLASCTQLTSLTIGWHDPTPDEVVLPQGNDVQLQHLDLYSKNDADYINVLRNLQDATQLTFIQFKKTCASNLEDGWPALLPSLQVIKTRPLPLGPPPQLVGYPLLRHLELTYCYSTTNDLFALPTWFSQLTQLETLNLRGSHLKEFPVCLMNLKQLCSLDLGNNYFYDDAFPEEIAQFSGFSALTHLDLATPAVFWSRHARQSYTGEACQQLLSLKNALAPGVLQY